MSDYKFTLHTHTIGFDGQNTAQDMINRAKELGFTTIGISNHFIVHPNIKQSKMYPYALQGGYSNIYSSSFAEVMSRFIPHYAEMEKLKQSNLDIRILRGMEVDFFNTPQWRDGFENAIKILQPDYIIGSAHFIEKDGLLLNSHDWKLADEKTQNELLSKYWDNIALAAKSGLFTWMAHLDLPKKVGLGRDDKWAEFESRAVNAIAESKIAMEINTSFYRSYCFEPYPSVRICQMAKNMNIPVLISDDAHRVDQIGRHFDFAEELIQKLGLTRYKI